MPVKSDRFNHMTDSELLDQYYHTKDQHWIGVLLQRYTLLLLGVCMKYLKNEEEAKDCVQLIFLKVLLELPKYRVTYFKSWLYMIAKNHCLMHLRNKQNRTTGELKPEFNLETKDTDLQTLRDNEHTYALLEQSINELNEEQKQCVTLFYLKKYSYQQIAEKTGFNLMQVKSHIQNGKRNLKLLLEKKLNPKSS